MIKKLVKIGDRKIPVKDSDITTGFFCDRCGVLIKEHGDTGVWTAAMETGGCYSSGENIVDSKSRKYIFKRLCDDCADIIELVAGSPELDVILRPYLKKEEPEERDK